MKTHQVCFEVWKDCDLAERHFFPSLGPGAKGKYVTGTSLYWFHDRCLRMYSESRPETYISVRPVWPEWHEKEALHVQVFEHPDLWAAYKAIGYDYKTKKFSNPHMFKEKQKCPKKS